MTIFFDEMSPKSPSLSLLLNSFWQKSENQNLNPIYQEKIQKLEKIKRQASNVPNILLVETEPKNFIASFLACISTKVNLFLGNPYWQQQEWQQVFKQVTPDLILGDISLAEFQTQTQVINNLSKPIIAIPTGGTSGKIRFSIHTIKTLAASVTGFTNYFAQNTINSCCILPLYHVSGLMQFLRSFLTEGKFVSYAYSDLKQGKKPKINPQEFFISLVPTQLQFLLETEPHWLAQFQIVLLGGAPAWRSLLDTARSYNLPLSLTYGMTETASGIVILKPEDFLQGNGSNGKVLSHAKVQVLDSQGNILSAPNIGIIKITSESLCLGYYPELLAENYLITDDLGYFDAAGYLYLVGRNSQKIITGGENVFPPEVESAILATGLVRDVCVVGIADSQWGQVVTAIFVPKKSDFTSELIREQLRSRLSSYKHPKHWIAVEQIPRSSQGKINLVNITALIKNRLPNQNHIAK
ncbi:MAG TPA: 2-succinylbenzoate--CoA ligase [Xenococcaceae cyanobacterium]|jgi:O-succinylbenzoic acid--CoA ligase